MLRVYRVAFVIHLVGNLYALLFIGGVSIWEEGSLVYDYYVLNYYYGVYSPEAVPAFIGGVFVFGMSNLVCVVGYDQLQSFGGLVKQVISEK